MITGVVERDKQTVVCYVTVHSMERLPFAFDKLGRRIKAIMSFPGLNREQQEWRDSDSANEMPKGSSLCEHTYIKIFVNHLN